MTIISTNAPTKERKITLSLPPDIPAPKYQLFQRVRVDGTEGVITGMEYIDFGTAIINNENNVGWCYTFNVAYGVPEKQLLNLNRRVDITRAEWEHHVKPIDAAVEEVA